VSRAGAWLRRRVIAPVLQADAPAHQIAWGAGLGMFFALLPVVGQLYIVPALWSVCRYALRRVFHLPTALLMVACVPPPLKLLTFYGYAVTGNGLMRALGYEGMAGGLADFEAVTASDGGNWFVGAAHAIDAALTRFGPPIILGGFVWACIGGALAFASAWALIVRYRRRRAALAPSTEAP